MITLEEYIAGVQKLAYRPITIQVGARGLEAFNRAMQDYIEHLPDFLKKEKTLEEQEDEYFNNYTE